MQQKQSSILLGTDVDLAELSQLLRPESSLHPRDGESEQRRWREKRNLEIRQLQWKNLGEESTTDSVKESVAE